MGQAASPSQYDFAGGDPVNFFDPTGRITNPPPPADQFPNGLYKPTEVDTNRLVLSPAIRGQNPDDPNPGVFNGVATAAVDGGTRFLNQLFNDLINAPQSIVDAAGSATAVVVNLLDPRTRCPQASSILDDIQALRKLQTYSSTASYLTTPEGLANSVFNIEMGIAGSALGTTISGSSAAEEAEATTGKTYQTYTKTNPETGQVYSGRTSGTGTPQENILARNASHHMNDEGYAPAELDQSSSNPDAIRGREQQLIDANGGAQSQGGTSGNKINGISPSNPNLDTYLDAATEEFGPTDD